MTEYEKLSLTLLSHIATGVMLQVTKPYGSDGQDVYNASLDRWQEVLNQTLQRAAEATTRGTEATGVGKG